MIVFVMLLIKLGMTIESDTREAVESKTCTQDMKTADQGLLSLFVLNIFIVSNYTCTIQFIMMGIYKIQYNTSIMTMESRRKLKACRVYIQWICAM